MGIFFLIIIAILLLIFTLWVKKIKNNDRKIRFHYIFEIFQNVKKKEIEKAKSKQKAGYAGDEDIDGVSR